MSLTRLLTISVALAWAVSFFATGTLNTEARHVGVAQRKPAIVTDGARQFLVLPTTGKNSSWSDITRMYKVVTAARAATEKYQDVAAALRDGYRYDPGAAGSWDRNGAYQQYTNSRLLGQPFDASAPPGLLYMKMGGLLMLAGTAFALPGASTVAALDRALPGSLASWRQRLNMCTARGTLTASAAAHIVDSVTCATRGGRFVAHGRWFARAWIWLPSAGLFDAKPDPMAGMRMGASKATPGKTSIMTQGPYQMEMMSTTGKAPTWTELQRVYTTFVRVKKANDKYRDVTVAQKKGFITESFLFVPGQGAHYINPYLVFGPWNLKTPPVLVYDPVHGKEQLRSVLYLMPATSSAKQLANIFPLSMAAWHRHLNNCFTAQTVLPIHDQKTCLSTAGAHWAASTPWMVHVWLWDKTAGLFDMDSNG